MTTTKKPPTQVAGVEGIAPKPITLTPEDNPAAEGASAINWRKVADLPTFRMFAVEKQPSLAASFNTNSTNGAPVWEQFSDVGEWMLSKDPQELFDEYCKWHSDKGYWPNETPMGEVV